MVSKRRKLPHVSTLPHSLTRFFPFPPSLFKVTAPHRAPYTPLSYTHTSCLSPPFITRPTFCPYTFSYTACTLSWCSLMCFFTRPQILLVADCEGRAEAVEDEDARGVMSMSADLASEMEERGVDVVDMVAGGGWPDVCADVFDARRVRGCAAADVVRMVCLSASWLVVG